MSQQTHYYANGKITVAWKPGICIHSDICFEGLAEVFDPRRRSWIMMSNAEAEKIIAQVKRAPSGALSIDENKISQ